MFPTRTANLSEPLAPPYQHAYAGITRNTTTFCFTIYYSKLYFRFFAIIYILYFYLISTGVIPNLAATAVVPLSAHPLRRYFAVLTTTTLPLSN
jgi:hypothetical protein